MYEIHIKTHKLFKWAMDIRQHVKKSFTNTLSESMLKQCVVYILQYEKIFIFDFAIKLIHESHIYLKL